MKKKIEKRFTKKELTELEENGNYKFIKDFACSEKPHNFGKHLG